MEHQLTINDLPLECVDEILKRITDRVDRIYARFVCKFWCALIDQDCTSERYQIYLKRTDNNDGLTSNIKLFSILLNSQRKKTTFYFAHVDFQGSEQFWRTKGRGIIHLNFNVGCKNIPLMEIVEHCTFLKTIVFSLWMSSNNAGQNIITSLENCIAGGKRNYSVRNVHFFCFASKDVTNIVRLVSQVFLGVQNVLFLCFVPNNTIDWAAVKVNSFSSDFQDFKFQIELDSSKGVFTFDSSANVSVKMKSLAIDRTLDINIPTHISNYTCGYGHLTSLNLESGNLDYRLDDLQELITQYPSLNSINVLGTNKFFPLTNPLTKNNNIKHLSLSCFKDVEDTFFNQEDDIVNADNEEDDHLLSINDAFVQSFKNLETFTCHKLNFSDFVKILHTFPHLKNLIIYEGNVDVNLEQTISHETLHELVIPHIFVQQTTAIYNFINLKELRFDEMAIITEKSDLSPNFDEHLKRVNCPKLENIYLNFDIKEWCMEQSEFTKWILNILELFPRLTEFLFFRDVDINIQEAKEEGSKLKTTDEILKTLLKDRRSLRKIGYCHDPHTLNIISPMHIKHQCPYGESIQLLP